MGVSWGGQVLRNAAAAACAVGLLGAAPAIAGTSGPKTYEGLIAGSFSGNDIGTSGFYLDTNGNKVPLDNTGTASFSISPDGHTLSWGSPGVVPPGTPDHSSLTFNPVPFSGATPNVTQFLLGTLTYTNGTSPINSLIFHDSLAIFGAYRTVIGGTPVTNSAPLDLATVQFDIVNTQNTGTNAQFDADFISFHLPTTSTACGGPLCVNVVALHVYEGKSVTVNVYGTLYGDPVPNDIVFSLDPTDGGFLTADTVPEPASIALFGLSLTGLAALRRRRTG